MLRFQLELVKTATFIGQTLELIKIIHKIY